MARIEYILTTATRPARPATICGAEPLKFVLLPDIKLSLALLDRKSLVTTLLVFLFSALLAVLYTNNRSAWLDQNKQLQATNDSLRIANAELLNIRRELHRQDSLEVRKVYANYFDPYDAEEFRMYGLYRDPERQYSVRQVAERFNIETASAVKYSRVLDEDWYIVPVKGVHLVRPGDTPAAIAKRYYFSPDDAALIRAFNGKPEAGKFVFIPFN